MISSVNGLTWPVRLITHFFLAAVCTAAALAPDHLFAWIHPNYQVGFAHKTIAGVFLACLLALSAKGVWAMRILLIVFALLQLPQLLHFVYFGTLISPQEVGLLGSEMDEVLVSLAGVWPALVAPIALVAVVYTLSFWLVGKTQAYRMRVPLGPTLLVLLLGVVLPVKAYNSNGSQAFYPNPHHYSIKNTLYAISWYLGKELPQRFSGTYETRTFESYQLSEIPSALPANIIVVMGESLTPNHMGLFGYGRETTPHFSALKNDPGFVYREIYAGGVSTKVAVPSFFNLKRSPDNVQVMYQREANLFMLAKSRGMHTWFLSTQSANLATYADGGAVDHFVTREDNIDEIAVRKDLVLLDLIEQVDFSQPNFVVLHERGSHSPYEKYHTDEFRLFPEDVDDVNIFRVNSYDNSVLFSDHVHNEIIEVLRDRSTLPTYVLFTGDHGELLGEGGRWGHSVLDPETAKVPFILYAINGDPEMIERARKFPYPTHYEMGRYIAGLLGYHVNNPNAEEGIYYANGKDIAGSSGYMRMQFAHSGELRDWKVILP